MVSLPIKSEVSQTDSCEVICKISLKVVHCILRENGLAVTQLQTNPGHQHGCSTSMNFCKVFKNNNGMVYQHEIFRENLKCSTEHDIKIL